MNTQRPIKRGRPKVPPSQHKRPIAFVFRPESIVSLKVLAHKAGISQAEYLERYIKSRASREKET